MIATFRDQDYTRLKAEDTSCPIPSPEDDLSVSLSVPMVSGSVDDGIYSIIRRGRGEPKMCQNSLCPGGQKNRDYNNLGNVYGMAPCGCADAKPLPSSTENRTWILWRILSSAL